MAIDWCNLLPHLLGHGYLDSELQINLSYIKRESFAKVALAAAHSIQHGT